MSYMMEIIFKQDSRFSSLWETFLQRNADVSPFYSLAWMAYQAAYSEDRFKDDLSFVAIDASGSVAAICPLYLEQYGETKRLSYRGEYLEALRAPLIAIDVSPKSRDKLRQALFHEIDRIAQRTGAVKCNFIVDPLCGDSHREGYNYLSRYGYLDASLTTVLIDLSKSVEDLWKDLRASYKALINKSERIYKIVAMDAGSITRQNFDAYAEVHHKAAGRITRPQRTFDIQYEMLLNDQASLIGVEIDGTWAGFAYFLHSRHSAYYGSGAEDPGLVTETPLGPVMQWTAIKHFAQKGLRYIELDNQYFGPQLFECPSAKDMSISFFKRGFGGSLIPLYRGIKYYDKDVMATELDALKHTLVASYFPERAAQ